MVNERFETQQFLCLKKISRKLYRKSNFFLLCFIFLIKYKLIFFLETSNIKHSNIFLHFKTSLQFLFIFNIWILFYIIFKKLNKCQKELKLYPILIFVILLQKESIKNI